MNKKASTNINGYSPLPPCDLSHEDEKMFSFFVFAKTHMSEAGMLAGFYLKNGDEITLTDKRTKRIIPLLVYQKEGSFFIRARDLKTKKIEFHEINEGTALFINKWISFNIQVKTCLKIKEEIYKIAEPKKKRNGMYLLKKKDPVYHKLQDRLSKIKNEKNEFVRKQQYEPTAKYRDLEKAQEKRIISYLIRNYPKRRVLQSPLLGHVLFRKANEYSMPSFY